MGNGRTYTYNAWEGELAGPINGSTDTIELVDMGALAFLPADSTGYLVIEPESPTLREYIYWRNINGSTLENVVRGEAGSSNGGQAHDGGAKVRAVSMAQMFEDIWDDLIAGDQGNATALSDHESNSGDPHLAAGYVKDAYVDAGDAATLASANSYSDGLDHDHDTPIGVHDDAADAHGVEADSNPHNHLRYADAEAVAALAAAGPQVVQVYKEQFSDTVSAATEVLRVIDLTALGIADTQNCVVSLTLGADNQQSRRSIVGYDAFSVDSIRISIWGTSDITNAGGCYYRLVITEYDRDVTTP